LDQIEQFQRHDLVWLSDQAWSDIFSRQTQNSEDLQRWQHEEWPAVVLRRDADAADDEVCIGFDLSLTDGRKPYIFARTRVENIIEHQSSLSLSTVIPVAPVAWQAALRELNLEATAAGVRLRVYGALALQFLTGLNYLDTNSRIDILFRPQDHKHLVAGLTLLQRYRGQIPLDGEVIFPRGQAVSWKEWLLSDSVPDAAQDQLVLVKDMYQARLLPKHVLTESLHET
jgi:phosphoribosyl-dephospho-CoA transferase